VDDAGIRRNQQYLGHLVGHCIADLGRFQPDANHDPYSNRIRDAHADSDDCCDTDSDRDVDAKCDCDTDAYYSSDSHIDRDTSCVAESISSAAYYHDVVAAKRKDGGSLFGRSPGEWRRFAL